MRATCTKVEEIKIRATREGISSKLTDVEITIDGILLDRSEMDRLANADGFESLAEMMRFWQEPTNRLPFHGHIIHWRFDGKSQGSGVRAVRPAMASRS